MRCLALTNRARDTPALSAAPPDRTATPWTLTVRWDTIGALSPPIAPILAWRLLGRPAGSHPGVDPAWPTLDDEAEGNPRC